LHPEGLAVLAAFWPPNDARCQDGLDGHGAIELAWSSGYVGLILALQRRSTLPPTAHQ
jgi:hypothetical protein